jgi:diguanylate cyclase
VTTTPAVGDAGDTDLLARYGGEEFAVLLRDCGPSEALGQSFSAGVAQWDGQESPERLVGRADVGLYEAKRAVRDRVIVTPAQPDAPGPPDPTTTGTAPKLRRIDTNAR